MEQGLKKTLKLPQLIALAAGGMIAAWMVEIQYWFSLTGTGSLLALILCAVFVLPLCFIYAEMTTMLPYAGGENVWVSNAFGWNTGWVCCWFVLLLYVMAMPTVSYGIASMIGYLHPITSGQTKLVAAIILVVWFFLHEFPERVPDNFLCPNHFSSCCSSFNSRNFSGSSKLILMANSHLRRHSSPR